MVFEYYLKVLLVFTRFPDVDWAGCPDRRRSTSTECMFIESKCVLWNAKKQRTVSHSSVEAEYSTMAGVASKLTWLSFLLTRLVCILQRLHSFL